ncbi:heterokaryon incompatibility protein-domain-containing protein [Podospora didyma]|uniref:Heterokaryon incompatibility protein-domain-containing protein n=1 Tax=Podospora didyma TaxID=330526 RepID=A0AAE0NUE5_9PEZI|nr:heterokaryon incompatibility protein-domain-containing protein [Podospora didyma]
MNRHSATLAQNQIRLLTIHPAEDSNSEVKCNLQLVSLDDGPLYNALSYVWGDPTLSSHITVDGERFRIPENLSVALRQIRNNCEPVVFWIDALCIDQSNTDEKNAQVPLMGRIYSSAAHVFASVGQEADGSPMAFRLLERWTVQFDTSLQDSDQIANHADEILQQPSFLASIIDPFDIPALKALDTLMLRPYWTRVWVQQELILARHATILCGRDSISFRKLQYFDSCHSYLTAFLPPQRASGEGSQHIHIPLEFHSTISTSIPVLTHKHVPNRPFWQRLQDVRLCSATDSRDIIYGTLDYLTFPNLSLVPDYSQTVQSIFTDFTHRLIEASQKLHLDGTNGIGEHREKSPLPALRSWVPDFREHGPNFYCLGRSHAGGSNLLDADRQIIRSFAVSDSPVGLSLETVGMNLGTVEYFVPMRATDDVDHLELWKMLIAGLDIAHPSSQPWVQCFFRTILRFSTSFETASEMIFTESVVGFMQWIGHVAMKTRQVHPSVSELAARLPSDDGGASMRQFVEISQEFPEYAWGFLLGAGMDIDHVMEHCTTPEGAIDIERLRDIPEQDLLSVFCGHTKTTSRVMPWKGVDEASAKDAMTAEKFCSRLARSTKNRSVFITSSGYVGLGPIGIAQDDELCVFISNDLPLVVRREGEHHRVVGASYVDGLMDGEALEDFGDKLQAGGVETFIIL